MIFFNFLILSKKLKKMPENVDFRPKYAQALSQKAIFYTFQGKVTSDFWLSNLCFSMKKSKFGIFFRF